MFHKQNIPASAPTQGDAEKDTEITENKEVTIMAETPNETTLNKASGFGRPFLGAHQAPTYTNTTQTSTSSDNRKLTIGYGITMSGEIENCDQLIVEGTVEATLNGAKLLDIATSGVFYGSVDIEEAIIAGRFEGDLTVDGRVTILSSGVVIGTITYRELTVEAGATIEGKISSFASINAKSESSTTDFSKLKAASKKTETKKADAA